MMCMRILYSIAFIVTVILFISGCAPRDVIREEDDDDFADNLREYEQEFDPSEYNAPFALQQEEEDDPTFEPQHIPDIDEPEAPTFIQGFRIQLYSTSDMEAAQDVYDVADSIFTDHWIYVVYEVPFYKVRLGDFETRPQANRTLANVVAEGFRDAWIVPDRVVKDPPEKIIEEEKEKNDEENEEQSELEEPDEYR